MKKKLAAALSGAALVLALSGCGDDSQEKLDDWAKGVCDQAAAQTSRIDEANTAITQVDSGGKPEDVKEADSAAFQQISEAYTSLAGIVDKAGDPPVDNGAELKKDAVEDLNALSASYADLKTKVDGLDTGDQAEFAYGLKEVSEDLGKVSKSGENALDTLREGEVGQAMSRQPGCRQPGGAGSATPPPSPTPGS